MPVAGPANSPNPRCVASSTTRCAGPTGRPDGRVYNLVTVVVATQAPTAQRSTTPFQFAFDANGGS